MTKEGWHADPFGRVAERFHDGVRWTSYGRDGATHVLDDPTTEPAVEAAAPPAPAPATVPVTGGHVLTEPVLVVRERPRLADVAAGADRLDVLDARGGVVGLVREIGQTRLEVVGTDGVLVLGLLRGSGPTGDDVVVADGDGHRVGRLVRGRGRGRQRYDVVAGAGSRVGGVRAENVREWRFRVDDANGRPVVRITRTAAGIAPLLEQEARYVVVVDDDVTEPLRTLAVAASLAVEVSATTTSGLVGLVSPSPVWHL